MENNTGYEKLERSASATTGHLNELSSSNTSLSYQQEFSSDDILLEDFPEEEIFVLSEEYVLMEAEYVLWQETASCRTKSKVKGQENGQEGPLMLPDEDSLQSLGEYFSLKTGNRALSHN